ncbi:nuclear transport factor 2 family protein [Pseudanabaena sp. FACHB-2040]|uniref:nuclear transport factor 2 family protein n=1 Tax=Pseudanabaena sp. FACHB-2040 TaxID=2692859 RepID=UPI00168445EB|nr:nuclear transport factor 2 family protein [Pseudanabaena sp. FACHB-2040]MBD2259095.1 nuclear transport factor 2 family protein [Pseudanabaena sp. FACHB-2040]
MRPLPLSLPLLTLGLALAGGLSPAVAAPPETAPGELVQVLSQIEAASDARDMAAVMATYGPSFTTADGFSRDQFEQTLQQFWQQYATLDYDIELVAWEPSDGGFTAETITRIQGTQAQPNRQLELTAEVRSRQRFENGQIVYQEVLAEQSQLTTGANPPSLTVNLPNQIAPGAKYSFDAIVQEPLRNRSLLGVALDEGVTAEDFLAPRPLLLESLSAGGLFKVGQAPEQPDNRWISAIIVREDGITVETRRLRIDGAQ